MAEQMPDRCPHRLRLAECDECASVPRMARWSMSLTGYQLADALEALARDQRCYTYAERHAILVEAARRCRG